MLGQVLGILAGILALIGAGALSFISLEQSFGPREGIAGKSIGAPTKSAPVAKPTTPQTATSKAPTKVATPARANGSLVPAKVVIEKTVVAPGPLRVAASVTSATAPSSTAMLTVRGVIERTNSERSQNGGLPALAENELLNRDAQLKVADMFAKQYFEHVSPAGVGPGDLAKTVGYAYVIVGENLALGDFGSDQGVVTAWMNSPGHRANILNTHYQEIGVAVGRGMYEGHETWLAVQSFGMPISSCPAISTALKTQIDANNIEIARLRVALDAKKAQLDATSQSDPNYNIYVGEFNVLVPEYNNLVESNRVSVATYNAGVQSFNDCINSAGSSSAH